MNYIISALYIFEKWRAVVVGKKLKMHLAEQNADFFESQPIRTCIRTSESTGKCPLHEFHIEL